MNGGQMTPIPRPPKKEKKVDLKALAVAFGGKAPSPDVLVARGISLGQWQRQRNIRAVQRATQVKGLIKGIQKQYWKRGEAVTFERGAEILRAMAKPAAVKKEGRSLGARIKSPSLGDVKAFFKWTWEH